MKTEKWILTGDANPLTHGGYLTKKESEACYRIIVLSTFDDACHPYLVTCCYVDLDDSWMDKNAVGRFCGCTADEVTAMDCISYYGVYEFGGSYEERFHTKKDAREQLISYGVTNVRKYK